MHLVTLSRRRAALLLVAVVGLSACGGDSARTTSNATFSSAHAFSASSGPSTTIDTTTSSTASAPLDSASASSSTSGPGPAAPAPGDTAPGATEPATTEPPQPGETTTVPPPPPSTTTTTTSPPPSSGAISIKNFTFSPNPLRVAVGSLVTTTNDEAVTSHTWTSDAGAWDSGTLAAGQSYGFTFSSAGTFTYHCNIHPRMTGSVIVS